MRVDPEGLKCDSRGCWLTPKEWEFVKSGDYTNYYRLACAGGDTYACRAGKVAEDKGLLANITNWRLRESMRTRGISDPDCDERMEYIRISLAMSHALLIQKGTSMKPVVPTAQQISEFHNKIFIAFGAGDVFGGDVWFSNSIFPWCTSPSCQP
jgi:hypothetical protein